MSEILPTLDTYGQDLALQYKLDSPEFYKSIIKKDTYYYWVFGIVVTIILALLYLLKICWTAPRTNDTG